MSSSLETELQGPSQLIYFNPFFDYSSQFRPIIWPNALRWCHLPGSYIEVDSTFCKKVEDIRLGEVTDFVVNDRIVNIIQHPYDDDIVKFKPYGLYERPITKEHPVCVSDVPKGPFKSVYAIELDSYMWTISPRNSFTFISYKGKSKNNLDLLSQIKDFFNKEKSLTLVTDFFERLAEKYVKDDKYYIITKDSIFKDINDEEKAFQILYGLVRLCDFIGLRAGLDKDQFIIYEPRKINLNKFENIPEALENIQFTHKFVYRKITNVNIERYTGIVYTITVSPSHLYVADGVRVKNCEYIVNNNGLLKAALDRVVSLFITELEIDGTDSASKKKYLDYLIDNLDIIDTLRIIGLEYLTYGNFFVSLLRPFKRILTCPKCHYSAPYEQAKTSMQARLNGSFKFSGTCKCGYTGEYNVSDLPAVNEDLFIKRWSVFEIVLEWEPLYENFHVVWRVPNNYKDMIKSNEDLAVKHCHVDILNALKESNDIKLNDDMVFHGKDKTLSGLQLRGWGLSRIYASLSHIFNFQVIHRMNEAIGLDYITPLRIITPMPRTGAEGGDPFNVREMGSFVSTMRAVIDKRRKDPTIWHISPFPIKYDALGGDGRVLAPRDLLEHSQDVMLSSLNIPVELYRATTNVNALPIALRLMESSWSHLVSNMNRFLRWVAKKLRSELEWDDIHIKLARPKHVDDINMQLARMQLMMAGRISSDSALRGMGLDFETEQKKMLEEQYMTAKESLKTEQKFQGLTSGLQLMQQGQAQAQIQGQAQGSAQGGASPEQAAAQGGQQAPPMPGGGDIVQQILTNIPQSPMQQVSPQEIDAMATSVANSLFTQPETVKDSALRQLKNKNELLWMSVKTKLDDMRDAARRQGVVMAQQQASQQAAMNLNIGGI